jgi:hypothetical protein
MEELSVTVPTEISTSAVGRKHFSLFRSILAQKNVVNDVTNPNAVRTTPNAILYYVIWRP